MESTVQSDRPAAAPSVSPFDRVMCVDDEAVDQMVYKRLLTRSGLARNIAGYTLPDAALDALTAPDADPVDLILLDVNMPRMNGFEFLTAAQEGLETGTLPPVIVMLTTPLGPQHAKHAATFEPALRYLDKPLRLERLTEAMAMIQHTG